MALFLQLTKYSADGAQGHLDGGFAARVDAGKRALESVGGELKGYWMVEGGGWHAVQLFDFPDDSAQLVRGHFQLAGSGAVEDYRFMRLVDPTEVDDAKVLDYQPPSG